MKTTLSAFSIAWLLLLAGCAAIEPLGSVAPQHELAILHINDHHSSLAPVATRLRFRNSAQGETEALDVSLGGFPRVVAAIEALSAQHRNVLKLHAGDATTGTLYYTLEQGRADAELMNLVCFDAMAVGNHEFDAGDAGLAQFVDFLHADPVCRTPVLAANVLPGPASVLGDERLQRSTVIERGGQRIGIVGLSPAGKIRGSSRPDPGTLLLDELPAAQTEIDALGRRGVDRIVLLSHLGYEQDKAIAARLHGVDVIVGGDSHSLLGDQGLQRHGLSPVGPYPTVLANLDGDRVCIVQAWQYAAAVGELKVVFDDAGRVQSCTGQAHVLIGFEPGTLSPEALAVLQADIAATPELRITPASERAEVKLAPHTERVNAFGASVVSVAEQNLCMRRVPGTRRDGSSSRLAGCNEDPHVIAHGGDVQQWVAEAYLAQGQRYGGADIALQNGGGARVDLAAGPVTVEAVHAVLPFRGTLVRLKMSGAEVKAVLEEAIDGVLKGNTGAYPYAAGLRWQVDLGQPFGARLSRLEQRRADGHWGELQAEAVYTVISNDFIAAGKDGYTTLGAIRPELREDTFLSYSEAFLRHAMETPALARLPSASYSTQRFIDTP